MNFKVIIAFAICLGIYLAGLGIFALIKRIINNKKFKKEEQKQDEKTEEKSEVNENKE